MLDKCGKCLYRQFYICMEGENGYRKAILDCRKGNRRREGKVIEVL